MALLQRRHAFAALVAAGSVSASSMAADQHAYKQTNLVSDGFLPADHVDPNLVNSWGIARGPNSPWWVADADSGEEKRYQIVGDLEADIKQGLIAISSPVARALIGKHEGDTVTIEAPAGQREYEIVAVSYEA